MLSCTLQVRFRQSGAGVDQSERSPGFHFRPVAGAERTDGRAGRAAAGNDRVGEPRTRQIDQLSSQAIVELILQEEAWVIPAVQAERTAIAALADVVVERMRRGGRLVYVGAGTSGRLGMLDAIECIPTYGLEPGRIVALVAGGPAALTGPVEAAEDDEEAGRARADCAGHRAG
jgi:N-acetylmuramic acid 6-phosphate (MurNAc-6-P) etherase